MKHDAIQAAARTRLLGLEVATTGATTLGASGSTYTRAAGSFIADGFAAGMEVTDWLGARSVIRSVAALSLTVDEAVTTQAAAGGRTLSVGLPARRAWENVDFTPTAGKPYVRESYAPGPASQISVGLSGQLELDPLYIVHIHAVENTGREAARRYADAVLLRFHPLLALAVGDDTARVRTDTAPFASQLVRGEPGWVTAPVHVPLRLRTRNVAA